MVILVITAVFLVIYALLITYYYFHWLHIPLHESRATDVSISVIIAARNEEVMLPLLVQDLERQQYPASNFEVIIVDDFSTDGTAVVGERLPPNMRMIRPGCAPGDSSKKKAVAAGIEAAGGELLVFTDADCRVRPGWLALMAGMYRERNASFIAAPVKFFDIHGFLEVFQSLDFLVLQGITAAGVHSGFHTMCNGANIAYAREAFYRAGGFEGIDHVATGDDMLLMYKIWKMDPQRVHYLRNPEAIVRTEPMRSWRRFFMQRKRWASKSLVYRDYRIIGVLSFVFILNMLFPLLVVTGFLYPEFWWLALSFWIIKTVIELPFVYSVAGFFGARRLMPYFFLVQPVHILYTVFTGLAGQAGRYEWKGRITK